MPEFLQLQEPASGVVLLTLTRPEVLNALTDAMVAELDATLGSLARDRTCRVLVITGDGRGFCAGFDLRQAQTAPHAQQDGEAIAWSRRQEAFSGLVSRLRSMPQPVVAAVNGPASGGGLALALGCDIRLAARSAVFHAPFVKIGMSGCDMGVSWLLPRCVGLSHSFQMLLTGRKVEADEALRIGLASDLIADELLIGRAIALGAEIAANDAFAVWMTKRGAWANLEAGSLQAAMELENRTQMLTRTTGALAAAADRFNHRT